MRLRVNDTRSYLNCDKLTEFWVKIRSERPRDLKLIETFLILAHCRHFEVQPVVAEEDVEVIIHKHDVLSSRCVKNDREFKLPTTNLETILICAIVGVSKVDICFWLEHRLADFHLSLIKSLVKEIWVTVSEAKAVILRSKVHLCRVR